MRYYFSTKIDGPFETAIERARQALKQEGFGIISEIDMQKALKEKIQVDFRPYVILGACNPGLAHEALKLEDKVGTMLPCNVIVQDAGDGLKSPRLIRSPRCGPSRIPPFWKRPLSSEKNSSARYSSWQGNPKAMPKTRVTWQRWNDTRRRAAPNWTPFTLRERIHCTTGPDCLSLCSVENQDRLFPIGRPWSNSGSLDCCRDE